jgi:hypothetical protein
MKTHHGPERLRLRGRFGARDEFHPAASCKLRQLRPPSQAPARVSSVRSVSVRRPTQPGDHRRLSAATSITQPQSIAAPALAAAFFDCINPLRTRMPALKDCEGIRCAAFIQP